MGVVILRDYPAWITCVVFRRDPLAHFLVIAVKHLSCFTVFSSLGFPRSDFTLCMFTYACMHLAFIPFAFLCCLCLFSFCHTHERLNIERLTFSDVWWGCLTPFSYVIRVITPSLATKTLCVFSIGSELCFVLSLIAYGFPRL